MQRDKLCDRTLAISKQDIPEGRQRPRNVIESFLHSYLDFPGGSVVKNPPANAGDVSSIPGSGRSLGVGNGNPL